MPALAPNSLIAVTGITGYIGSYVGLAALQAGHRVRGTVRSLQRAEPLKEAYAKQGIDVNKRLELVVVDDLLSADQWQNAIQGVDGVAHVAAPMELFGDRAFVDKAVGATISLLQAAKRVSSVKRVVLTSSAVAVISAPRYSDKILTDEDWNDDVVRIVENNEPTDTDDATRRAAPFIPYAAGKTKAEKAAWKFVQDERPQFDLVSTLPYANFGPALHGDPPSTAAWINRLLKNEVTQAQMTPPQWFIDVRDDGRLHVLGLTTPSLGGKRIWAAAEPWGWNATLAILRKHFPHIQVPEDLEPSLGQLDPQRIDNKVATELLGGWIDLETSVVDFVKSLGY